MLRSIRGSASLHRLGVGAARVARGLSDARAAGREGGEKETSSWVKDFLATKANVVVAGGLVLLGLNVAGTAAFDAYYKRQVMDTLTRGVTPEIERPSVLAREPVRQQVATMLRPKEPTRFYCIITGSPGSGKSTLVREVCAALGGGVGYVDISPAFETDFGKDLGSAFNFRFEEHLTMFNIVSQTVLGTKVRDKGEEHPLSSLRRSAEALQNAAAAYRRRVGRPFVLVIDSVDRLGREQASRQALEALIEYAREWAQAGVITCVFVTSDWATVDKLRGVQPGSRAAPPMHIEGIKASEALQYLSSLGITEVLGEECAGLVGGSLLMLERCAGMIKAGLPFPEVKSLLLRMIEHGYETAGLLDNTPQQGPGLCVVEALLKNRDHTIPASQWRSMVPEKELQKCLLKGGVFSFDGAKLAFDSRLALTYAQECLYNRLAPQEEEKHKALSRSRLGGWW